jgi:hypothetical protein
MIHGMKGDQSIGYGSGLAATNAIALSGIKVGDRLLAVISFTAAGATPNGRAITDFTVGAGTITAATIDLTGLRFVAIWTSVAGS